MTNKNNSLNLIDLDQQGLLNSFKNYLRTQDEFKDYDFNASNLNVLLSILATNTFKNMFYMNMSFGERWLDSAQLRTSLFSHSKDLNYLPRSVRSAVAKVVVSFEASGESQPYIIPKGSQFSTLIKSKSYTFTVPETIIVSSADTNFEFTTDIYEGVYIKDSYIFKDTESLQRFKVSNRNVDLRSLTVNVFEDGNEVAIPFKLARTLLDLKSSSEVFFLQTSETSQYEILFGDNILGRKPKNNSIIVLDYRISAGTAGNGGKSFSIDFDPTGQAELIETPDVEVLEASKNGSLEETNESIKYYGPRHFQVQERGVVSTDYEIILKNQFPEINAISAFGGEVLSPPQFGRVFISVDISNVDGLPDSKVTEYTNFLKGRSMFAIEPVFIEPEELFVSVETFVRYDLNVTSSTPNRIKTIVTDVISEYNKTFLNDFQTILRFSNLLTEIDQADDSIVSNITSVKAYKKINPSLSKAENFVIDFGFAITDSIPELLTSYSSDDKVAVTSSIVFFKGYACYIEDNGNGILRLVKKDDEVKTKIVDIGTVDYTKGIVKINNLQLDRYDGNGVKIYVVPSDLDIASTKNNIMSIEAAEINVSVEPITIKENS